MLLLFLFLLFGDAFGYTLPREDITWGYDCHNGPNVWSKQFKECSGFTQSPISLPTAPKRTPHFMKRIEYTGFEKARTYEVVQENRAINVIYKGKDEDRPSFTGSVFDESRRFLFDRMIVRVGADDCSGSEHILNGTRYGAEFQKLYYDSKFSSLEEAMKVPGAVAVIVTIREATDKFVPLWELYENLDKINGTSKGHLIQASKSPPFIPKFEGQGKNKRCVNCDYYFYEGSLTYPPCSQVALWHVYMSTLPTSRAQLGLLRSVIDYVDHKPMTNNLRPVQPINFRDVLQYRDGAEHKMPPPPPPGFHPNMAHQQQQQQHQHMHEQQIPAEFLRQF